jgi:hypothetical protein
MHRLRTILVGAVAVTAAVPVPASATPALAVGSEASGWADASALLCENTGTTVPVRRIGGPLGWLTRLGRDGEASSERPAVAVPITSYLRSPLLSSFFGVLPCPQERAAGNEEGAAEHCAHVLYRTPYGDEFLEVPLPQHGAQTGRRLKAYLQEQQQRGEPVHLRLAYGVELELAPGVLRDVVARDCRM